MCVFRIPNLHLSNYQKFENKYFFVFLFCYPRYSLTKSVIAGFFLSFLSPWYINICYIECKMLHYTKSEFQYQDINHYCWLWPFSVKSFFFSKMSLLFKTRQNLGNLFMQWDELSVGGFCNKYVVMSILMVFFTFELLNVYQTNRKKRDKK